LRAQLLRLFAEAVFVARARRTTRTNNSRRFLAAFGDPADVQNPADAFQLCPRLCRNLAAAAAGVAPFFDRVDRLTRVNVLCPQRGRKINTGAEHMVVTGRVPGPD
jgi:hypothetical protein